jgi:DNA-binding transcriptional LysR family regulator
MLQRDGSVTFERVGADGRGGGEPVTVTPMPATMSTLHLELNHAAALAGLGIAGLASYATDAALRERRLERVLPGWRLADLSIWACMPTRKHVPAGTRASMDFLLAEFGGRDADPWADEVARPVPARRVREACPGR